MFMQRVVMLVENVPTIIAATVQAVLVGKKMVLVAKLITEEKEEVLTIILFGYL